MSLKLNFGALSFGASVDQQTGHLSVFDIVEEVRTPVIPVAIPTLVVSLSFEKLSPGSVEGKVHMKVITPDGQMTDIGAGPLRVPAEKPRIKAVFRFGGFPLHATGLHKIVVIWTDLQDKQWGDAAFEFRVLQETHVAQGAAPSDGSQLLN